jgi:serine/threonine-protein kinase
MASAAQSAEAPGAPNTIGKYQPIFELGRGGMATVYLCVLKGLGGFSKLQVVKRLKPELSEDAEFRSMFLEEARLAARINHPNVVQTNEVGIDGSNYFIAMEYLEGQSLEAFFRRASDGGKSMPLRILLPILIDTLRGLHHAHELKDFQGNPLKVVHRDVSPHNIFVTYDGSVKVVDFGIAKAADSAHETRTGVVKGKVAYMAPEQVSSKGIDRRADIFAVGAILWRGLTGKRMWRGMNEMEILVKLAGGEIPSPTTMKADLPKELVAICEKALAPKPEDRYQTAAEMMQALEEYLQRTGDRASAHEIGQMLQTLFADRREEVSKAVEQRLGALQAGVALNLDALVVDPAQSSRLSHTPSTSASFSRTAPLAAAQTNNVAVAARPPVEATTGDRSTLEVPSAPRGNLGMLVGIGAGALVLGVVAVLGLRAAGSTGTTAAPVPSVAPGATAPASPSATAGQESVALKIAVTPASARIFIDDEPLDLTRHYPKDGAMHRVRAEAPGYEPQSQLIPFADRVVELSFMLQPRTPTPGTKPGIKPVWTPANKPTAAASAEPPQTAAPPPPPPPQATTTGKKTVPVIDTDPDPWRKSH